MNEWLYFCEHTINHFSNNLSSRDNGHRIMKMSPTCKKCLPTSLEGRLLASPSLRSTFPSFHCDSSRANTANATSSPLISTTPTTLSSFTALRPLRKSSTSRSSNSSRCSTSSGFAHLPPAPPPSQHISPTSSLASPTLSSSPSSSTSNPPPNSSAVFTNDGQFVCLPCGPSFSAAKLPITFSPISPIGCDQANPGAIRIGPEGSTNDGCPIFSTVEDELISDSVAYYRQLTLMSVQPHSPVPSSVNSSLSEANLSEALTAGMAPPHTTVSRSISSDLSNLSGHSKNFYSLQGDHFDGVNVKVEYIQSGKKSITQSDANEGEEEEEAKTRTTNSIKGKN